MSRLRRFFRRSNLDRELAGEIAAHIQELADELMESGMSRQDALLADQPKPRQGDQPGADYLIVSPEYFSVMGIPLLQGRDFNQRDTLPVAPSIIVNQSFAE